MDREFAVKIARTLMCEFGVADLIVDHDRNGIVYQIDCCGQSVFLSSQLSRSEAANAAGLFLRRLRRAAA